jgi:hypothetical protein
MVERLLSMQEAEGSIPSSSSMIKDHGLLLIEVLNKFNMRQRDYFP